MFSCALWSRKIFLEDVICNQNFKGTANIAIKLVKNYNNVRSKKNFSGNTSVIIIFLSYFYQRNCIFKLFSLIFL